MAGVPFPAGIEELIGRRRQTITALREAEAEGASFCMAWAEHSDNPVDCWLFEGIAFAQTGHWKAHAFNYYLFERSTFQHESGITLRWTVYFVPGKSKLAYPILYSSIHYPFSSLGGL